MVNTILKGFLTGLLTFICSPITIVTLFTPTLIYIGKLRSDFLQSHSTSAEYTELTKLVNNKWADVLLDVNIQYVVLFTAFTFTIIQVIVGVFYILENHKLKEVANKWKEDNFALLFSIISILLFIIGIIIFFSGNLTSPAQFDLYKQNSDSPWLDLGFVHAPPYNSNITYFRLALGVYGIIVTIFMNYLKKTIPIISNEGGVISEQVNVAEQEINEEIT